MLSRCVAAQLGTLVALPHSLDVTVWSDLDQPQMNVLVDMPLLLQLGIQHADMWC